MKTVLRIPFALLSFCLLISINSYANTTPEAVINTLHSELIDVMQEANELKFEGRYKQLSPIINDSFDFKTIARVVMGRYWKKLDEEQQSRFIKIFSELSTATYASRFSGYSGESFEFLEDKEMKKGRVLVKTQLRTEHRVVPFNYVLQPGDDKWRIINVIVEGISDLSLKRADYSAIMQTGGFEALIKKIKKKIKQTDSN